jgi:amino acid adenylation domain-containing protein
VRFADSIAELVNQSSRLNGQETQNALPLLLEVGPGQTLSTLARQHSALSREQVLASLPHPQAGQAESAFLLRTLGKLWLSGVAVDWRGFYPEQHRRRLPLPTYPFERQRYWLAPSSASRTVHPNLNVTVIPKQEQNGNSSFHARPDLPSAYEAPSNEVEQRMAAIWQTVLGIDQVGKHDTFFELGGHSVLALQLMAQIRTVFHVNVPLRHLFEAPTIAGLAKAVVHHQHLLETTSSALPVTLPPDQPTLVPDKAQRHLPFPLTDVQQAYWLGRSGELELSNVATHGYIEFEATMLDLERLTQAVQSLITRHEMLRTIILPDGQQQILANVPPYQIKTLDLHNQEPMAVETQLANLRQQLSHQVLPADQWPLFEIRATLLDGQRTRLHVSLDMLIMDAWSIQLLGRELAQLYTNPETPLPPLDLSFRDYVLAELALRDTESYKRAQSYWRSRLAELPPAPALPLAQSPSALTHPRFVRYSTRLEKANWQHLKDRAAQAGLTPSGVLLAAFAQVLATWSNSPRFTLNLTLFNRLPLHPQVNDVIGDFTSLTLLAVDYSAAASFEERARHLQEQLWTDLDHRLMTGVQVLRERAQAQGKPLMPMPVVFTSTLIQDQRDRSEEPTWIGEQVYSISQTPQVWLDHQVIEEAGDLILNWDVVEALFPEGFIEAMFTAYKDLLHRLITTQEVWHLPAHLLVHSLLPASQLAQRVASNAKAASVSPALLHTLFLEQVAQRPDQPAVISPTQTLSYAELGLRAMLLGKQLRRLGARPNMLVAVVMEKGWEQVVATLGILLAGAAYLPIEPTNPAERLAYLLEHGEVQLVLTQSWLLPKLYWPPAVTCLNVDNLQEDDEASAKIESSPAGILADSELLIENSGLAMHDMLPVQGPEDLAYVIYTSGSTGLPKGVMIDHRGAVNTILDINQRFQVGPEDRVLALSSLSFDLSVYDIFGTLAAGGTIVLPIAAERHDPAHWAELLVKEQVTLWNSVPALLELLVDYLGQHPELDLSSLRLALLSGDWIPLTLPDRVKARAADVEIISLGGATEASIWSICYPITQIKPSWTSIPYGKPLLNQQWHILTPSLDPCPVWVPGHLYIGGVGLAKGYWRDAAKTAASFITHPHTGECLYRTGDIGRYLPDGNIEFLGREDFQVKVQGYRIELGEIETTLEQHPAVRATAVVAQGETHSEKRLVAYVVLQEQQATDQLSLRSFLQGKLPAYMVPTSIVFLDALPLTANGKVDRSQLQARSEPSTVSTPSVPALPPVRSAMIEQLTRIVSDVLQLEQLDPTMNLLELGASSLEMIRIMNRLEKELHFRPQFSEFYTQPTIQGLGLSYERHHQPQQLAESSGQETKKRIFEILIDPAEREAFKQRQLGLRGGKDGDQGSLSLPLIGTAPEEILQERYAQRSSQRRFGTQLLPFTTLSAWLENLRGVSVEGKPKYLYASAGGLYPVQTYLYSKADRIEGLAAGYYYYHPLTNRFIQLSSETQFPRNTYFWINQPVFDEAAFALFFVAQMQAITPIYGEMSRDFCFIEAGLMAQLLEMSAPREQLGLCQIGGLDFEPLRPLFALEESHTFLYSLLGGPPVEDATSKQAGKMTDEWEVEDL